MRKGTLTMSQQELDRLHVIQRTAETRGGQAAAARQLGVSVRQVKRLVRRYRQEGAQGLGSHRRGHPSPRGIAPERRAHILAVVRRYYADFGPTLACEKLQEGHGVVVSRETLRQWLIAAGLWQPKRRRAPRLHPRRPRRPCVGELLQIDGSPHDWFEGRAPACTLLVFIDDATSRLMALRFVPAETTQASMETLQSYLAEYGRPVAIYSDQHSIFRVNHADREGERPQFSRALETLDLAPIHAHPPQANGRVERAHQTLQDRLVKA
ncbi:MAG: ISNCY family transposase [Nitrospira sp.]|nr:ISNCY family transposase [Nitrospira sp.]